MGDFGEEGAEGSEVGEERGEDFVEDEDFGVGDLGGESLGKRDLFLLDWDVGPNLEGDLGV